MKRDPDFSTQLPTSLQIPDEGLEAQVHGMTPEDLHVFGEITKGHWHNSAAFLTVAGVLFPSLYAFEVVPTGLLGMVGLFAVLVLALTLYETAMIWRDLTNQQKEVLLGVVASKRVESEQQSNRGAFRRYYLRFTDGKEHEVSEKVYHDVQAGDLFAEERALHSLKTLRYHLQKSEAGPPAGKGPSHPGSHHPVGPEPARILPMTPAEKEAIQRLHRLRYRMVRRQLRSDWLFLALFPIPFLAFGLFAFSDLVRPLPPETYWLGIGGYLAVCLLLFHRAAQNAVAPLMQDFEEGRKTTEVLYFEDKIVKTRIGIKGIPVVPAFRRERGRHQYFLVETGGRYTRIEDPVLFEQIRTGVAYRLERTPNSHHWLRLEDAHSGQVVYKL